MKEVILTGKAPIYNHEQWKKDFKKTNEFKGFVENLGEKLALDLLDALDRIRITQPIKFSLLAKIPLISKKKQKR